MRKCCQAILKASQARNKSVRKRRENCAEGTRWLDGVEFWLREDGVLQSVRILESVSRGSFRGEEFLSRKSTVEIRQKHSCARV